MMIDALFAWKWAIQIGVLLVLVAAAWRWGDGPEKLSVATMIYMGLVDWPYHWIVGRRAIIDTIDLGHVFIDLSATAIFVVIALRANRVYPLWLAALQVVSLTSHIARDLSLAISGTAYAILIGAPSYFQTAIIATGLVYHIRRTKRYGIFRSWRGSSNLSREKGQNASPNA